MVGPIPYLRVVVAALGATAVLAFLLNLALRDWIAALHLAIVMTFTFTTLVIAVHALVIAVIGWVRRNRDDPNGYQKDFGLAA